MLSLRCVSHVFIAYRLHTFILCDYKKLRNYSKVFKFSYRSLTQWRIVTFVNIRFNSCVPRFFQKKNEFYRRKISLTSLAITNYAHSTYKYTFNAFSRTPSILLLLVSLDANIIQRFLARTDSVQIILECSYYSQPAQLLESILSDKRIARKRNVYK